MNAAHLLILGCSTLLGAVALPYAALRGRFLGFEPERTKPAAIDARPASNPLLTRRNFGRMGAGLALAAATLPFAAVPVRAETEKLISEYPENQPVITAVKYVGQSAKPDQRCASCVLYQPGASGRGKCALFPKGQVAEQAWCSSWSAKPA